MDDTATPAAKMRKLILETLEGLKEVPFISGYQGTNRAVSTLTMAHNMLSDLEAELRTLRADYGQMEGQLTRQRNQIQSLRRALDAARKENDEIAG